MVNTILRVQNGLEPSPALLENLRKELGEFTQIVFNPLSSDNPFDFSQPYQQRINSLIDAFNFLIPHAQTNEQHKEKMRNFSDWLSNEYQLPSNSTQEACEKTQSECFALIIDAIKNVFKDEKTNEDINETKAIEYLNLAEQYYLLQKGRPNQATLSTVNSEAVLQVDTRMAALHKDTKNELYKIKEYGHPHFIPSAFLTLPAALQLYLLSSKQHILSDFKVDIERLISVCYGNKETIQPWLTALLKELQQQFSCSNEIIEELRDFSNRLPEIELFCNSKTLTNLRKIPLWYYQLSKLERNFVWSVLQKKNIDNCDEWYFPSRLRSGIPALANAGYHQLFKIKNDAPIALTDKRKRSAHLASRALQTSPHFIQDEHCRRNLEMIVSKGTGFQPLFIGTLISPLPYPLNISTPDAYLHEMLEKTISRTIDTSGASIQNTNHMLNMAKECFPTAPGSSNCSTFLAYVKNELEVRGTTENHPLFELVTSYEKLIHNTGGWFSLRELMLASQEHLIALALDMNVFGSCVSGKDRYALLLILSDSIALFADTNERWPTYGNQKDDTALRTIFLALLQSRHQIGETNYNALGAYGIKTLERYLPEDYIEHIRRWTPNNVAQDKMASTNELRKITPAPHPKSLAQALMEAKSISEPSKTLIFEQIKTYLPESLKSQLPQAIPMPQNSTQDKTFTRWLGHLLSQDKTAQYVRWIMTASTIPEETIRPLLTTIHRVTQQDIWPTVNLLSFLGAKTSQAPEGIQNIRKVMTQLNKENPNPLGILTKVLFIAKAQLENSTLSRENWTRYPKTSSFYTCLDQLLNAKPLSPQWTEACKAMEEMIEVESADIAMHSRSLN